METHNQALYRELNKRISVHLIANRRGSWFLPFFLVRAWWILLRSLQSGDRVLLGDMATAAIIPRAGLMGRSCKWFAVAHGLDVVWANPVYQTFLKSRAVRYLYRIIAVSRATSGKLKEKGFPLDRVEVIGNGVRPLENIDKSVARSYISREFGLPNDDNVWLLSVGRLVRRKGLAWFIRNVYASLPEQTVLVIAGQGPDERAIRKAAKATVMRSRIVFLGRISEKSKHKLLNAADIFIMPNQEIEGDMEGFGITILEAASVGLPVVATDIDGIRDASGNGQCARLVEAGNSKRFVCELSHLIRNDCKRTMIGKAASRYVQRECTWTIVGSQYLRILEKDQGRGDI